MIRSCCTFCYKGTKSADKGHQGEWVNKMLDFNTGVLCLLSSTMTTVDPYSNLKQVLINIGPLT